MLQASGPQAGQHGDSRAVVWASRGGLSPSRGPAGAPGAHGSVALRHREVKRRRRRGLRRPAEYEAEHYEQAAGAWAARCCA